MVWGLGFGIWRFRFEVEPQEFMVYDSRFEVYGLTLSRVSVMEERGRRQVGEGICPRFKIHCRVRVVYPGLR